MAKKKTDPGIIYHWDYESVLVEFCSICCGKSSKDFLEEREKAIKSEYLTELVCKNCGFRFHYLV